MDFRRTIKCSNCSVESNIQISSDFDMKELLLAGKCSRCGGAMQVTYHIVDTSSQQSLSSSSSSSTSSSSNDAAIPNLDESLFGTPKVDNDMLRDLMDDS